MLDSLPIKHKDKDDPIYGEPKTGSFDDSGISLFNNGFFMMRKCCVPNCKDVLLPRHRFPVKDLCTTLVWINKINSKLVLNMNFNEILQSCFVCHAHFRKEYKVGRKNLTVNAVPTLNLPEWKVDAEDLHTLASDNEFHTDQEIIFEAADFKKSNSSLDDTKVEYIVITVMNHQTPGTSKGELDINADVMESIVTAAKVLMPLNISEGNLKSNINTQSKVEELPATLKNCKQDYQISNATKYLQYVKPYKCKICGFRTLENYHLIQHSKIHKNNKCKISISANVDHHKKEKLLACSLCDYKTTLRKVLKEHLKIHTKENLFICKFCDYTSKKQRNFKNHLKSHNGEKPHMCEFCGKTFKARFSFREHLRIHTGDKPYLCQYCDYRTTHKIVLKRHIRTHTGEKPHMCNICGHRVSRSIDLQNHMRRHTGEKPYMCDVCGYRTSRKDLLKTHFTIHTGEKKFACSLCNYKCRTSNRLREHTRTHTGEKPFTCTICNFSFAIKSNLQNHLSMHTKRNFKCKMCDYNTWYKGYFEKHVKKHQT